MMPRRSSPTAPAGERDLVIKVKYGDALKRFNAHASEVSLDQTLTELKKKLIKAYKLSPDADLVLTYTDVDGDTVLLDDDDDLHDAAIRQGLDPLRIDLQLKRSTNVGVSEPRMQGAYSGPSKAVPLEEQLAAITSTIVDAVKSIPDTTKLSHDAISGAAAAVASSAPVLSEIVQHFSRFAAPNNKQASNMSAGDPFGSASDTTKEPLCDNTRKNLKPSGCVDPAINKLAEKNCNNESKGKSACTPPVPFNRECSQQINAPPYVPPFMGPFGRHAGNFWGPRPFCGGFSRVDCPRWKTTSGPTGGILNNGYPHRNSASNSEEATFHKWVQCDICRVEPIVGPRYKSNVKENYDLCSNCFSLHGNEVEYTRIDSPSVFHRSVQCDGCGITPIVGPRYMSNVKDNYDLCSACFTQHGNDAEYTRIDRPMSPIGMPNNYVPRRRFNCPSRVSSVRARREKLESRFIQDVTVLDGTVMLPSTQFTKIWRMSNNGNATWPFGTQLLWIGGDHFSLQNSVFLEIPPTGVPVDREIDVAVDFIAPESPGRYISYWRLMSPTGQKFGQRVWVLIQVEQPVYPERANNANVNLNVPPESSGLNENNLIDVNVVPAESFPVDFAPGEGDRVEEVAPLTDRDSEAAASNMHSVLPAAPAVVDLVDKDTSSSVPPMAPAPYGPQLTKPFYRFPNFVPSVTPVVQDAVNPSLVQYPTVESMPLVSRMVPVDNTPTSIPVNYPFVDLTPSDPPLVSLALDSVNNFSSDSSFAPAPPVAPRTEAAKDEQLLEEALLKELELMGFKQVDLNKEVLRQNNYSLEQSVNELCGYNEWDPLLNDLQEMGFNDHESNKKALEKNGGSITRTVMDLVAREKSD